MAYYLGIDIGTSGTKSLIVSITPGGRAKVLATASADHALLTPRAMWTEQDPDGWWRATQKSVKSAITRAGIDAKRIACIGLSGQMHGLVITDGDGAVLRPAIIWNDQRSGSQAEQIEQAMGGRRKLIVAAGNPAMTSYTLTKLLWVRENEPRIYDRIKHLLLPKDYIRLKLTGEYIGDVSDMSGTLMLDQRKRNWSRKILSTFQIDRSILPPVVESHEITGRLRREAATKLGLAVGTPVVGGAGDQAAGAVGSGVVSSGLTSATMGTSGVVYVHSRDYRTDKDGRVGTFCSAVAGQYCLFGCMLSTGGSFQWYRNVLGQAEVAQAKRSGIDPYELLTAQASQAPAGCEGLFWLPYLSGERTPHADPNARACWVGMHMRTGRNEMVRSVLEGATFAMNDAVSLMREMKLPIRQIRLSGGGSRSAFWRQLQADIYGTTCVTINTEEGPAFGAALLGATGVGHFSSVVQACKACIKVTDQIKPNAASRRLYQKLYGQYIRLYPALKDEFAGISQLGL